MLDDLLSDFLIGEAIRFEPGKQSLYFIIQKVTDLFQYGHRIRFYLGILPQLDQFMKHFIDIGQIEISCQDQMSGNPVILPEIRMTRFDNVRYMCTVPEMSYQNIGQLTLTQ